MKTLHIIHLAHRQDRLINLMDELRIQQILHRRIWDGVADQSWPAKGILLAHQQIVEYAKKERLNKITIAEDDIKFSAKGAYRYYCDHEPAKYDLYLGGVTWGRIETNGSIYDFSGASLYTISERFYSTFLDLKPGLDFDRQLAGKGAFKVCHPMVVTQYNGYSDNRSEYLDVSGYVGGFDFYKG